MSSASPPAGRLKAREICALALIGALIFAAKLALAALPNISLNALLIILTAVFFGWKVMYAVFVYVLLEGLMFGFGLWWFSYIYAWPLLGALAALMRRVDSAFVWAMLAGAFGLCFGALCAIPYLFMGGWTMALSYWVSGIPFDLAHCAGNLVSVLLLYRPLRRAMAGIIKPA